MLRLLACIAFRQAGAQHCVSTFLELRPYVLNNFYFNAFIAES